MRRDPAVFCLGEDIGVSGGWGGAFTVTLGLEQEFPDRMLNTPIAELGFFGAAVGAAIMGMRPIVDVQYGDFLFLAMDQIVNNAAKLRYMSGGTIKVPLVMRAPVGATGRGAQHAQNMERFFTGVPGIKVVAPSTAYDAKGILKSAVRDDNPVLIFEHKLLYGSKGARTEPGAVDATSEVPDAEYTVPLECAAVRRAGSQVTILAWLLMAHLARQAADDLSAQPVRAQDGARGRGRRGPENRRSGSRDCRRNHRAISGLLARTCRAGRFGRRASSVCPGSGRRLSPRPGQDRRGGTLALELLTRRRWLRGQADPPERPGQEAGFESRGASAGHRGRCLCA
jgi:pyruvate/2-oxoglutarate/acetoin dehydrogenase E1 component